LLKFGGENVPDDEIWPRLEEKADEYLKLREDAARIVQAHPDLTSLLRRTRQFFDEGDFAGADEELIRGIAERRRARDRAAHDEADLLALQAGIRRLQFDYLRAVSLYEEAAKLVANLDKQKYWLLLIEQARTLSARGTDFTDNDALARAITIYRSALDQKAPIKLDRVSVMLALVRVHFDRSAECQHGIF
jgi:tetratricopeptide (TPR) repeat protein